MYLPAPSTRRRFLTALERDPNSLYQLGPRQFEELVAGAYEEHGCEEVILTPRSGDKGRDVIATLRMFRTVRILEQVKLCAPHRVVDADDVRALNAVLALDQGASKGIITTTSSERGGHCTIAIALTSGSYCCFHTRTVATEDCT